MTALGETHCHAKLTNRDVYQIKKKLAYGATCPSLARKYGTGKRNINDIKLGRTWRHIPDPIVDERLLERMNKARAKNRILEKIVVLDNGCWEWQFCTDDHGYGVIHANGQTLKAHRFAYQTFTGDIPEGLYLCHKCDNPLCVNPDHLFPGSQKDNMADAVRKNRQARGEGITQSKLTEEQVAEIRKELSQGVSNTELGQKYGVCQPLISLIKHRHRWKHI